MGFTLNIFTVSYPGQVILWMNSYGVTIQVKPLQQYFHMALFTQYVVVTFEPVDEILQCDCSMRPLQQYFHTVPFIQYVFLTFESVDEILWCYHSNKTSLAELFDSAIYFFGFTKRYLEFIHSSLLGVKGLFKVLIHCSLPGGIEE